MFTKEEYEQLNVKIQTGVMPTAEEMELLLEYAKAEAEKTLAASPQFVKCDACGADIQLTADVIASGMICEYCGTQLKNDFGAMPMPKV